MRCPSCGKEMKSKVRDYEYMESGLKRGVEGYHCARIRTLRRGLAGIRNIKQIHQWIAEYLLKKQGALTGAEFRFLRKAMGKSAKEKLTVWQ